MGNFCQCGDIIDDVFGVSDTFDENSFGLLINGSCESFRGRFRDPFDVNAKLLEGDLELVVGTTIEVRARCNVSFGTLCVSRSTHVETMLSPTPAIAVIAKNCAA
jgi:hypothetical protein